MKSEVENKLCYTVQELAHVLSVPERKAVQRWPIIIPFLKS